MKDYLKYPLSQEERDLITSIIWITAKSYKQRLYKRNRHQLIQFDDVDIPVEDEYDFFSLKTRGNFDFAKPIAMVDKVRIVEYVDSILLELSLYEFKEALTFDEKLVLLLYSFQKNTPLYLFHRFMSKTTPAKFPMGASISQRTSIIAYLSEIW